MRLRPTLAILVLAVLAACGDGGPEAPTPAEVFERARNAARDLEGVAQSLVAASELHDESALYLVQHDADAPTVCYQKTKQWFVAPSKSRVEETMRCDGKRFWPRILNRWVAVDDGKSLTTLVQSWPEQGEYCSRESNQGMPSWAMRWPLRPVVLEGSLAFWDNDEPAYAVSIREGGTVAGRYTWLVEAKPLKRLEIAAALRGFEGTSWFWVDAETFLPLKSEIHLDDGRLLWRETVTDIAYNVPVDDSAFALPEPPDAERACH